VSPDQGEALPHPRSGWGRAVYQFVWLVIDVQRLKNGIKNKLSEWLLFTLPIVSIAINEWSSLKVINNCNYNINEWFQDCQLNSNYNINTNWNETDNIEIMDNMEIPNDIISWSVLSNTANVSSFPYSSMCTLLIVNHLHLYLLVYASIWLVITVIIKCVKDSRIREYTSTYDILTQVVLVLFYIMIHSESLFFIPFFWSSFHASCSSIWMSQSYQTLDPWEVTSTNTILLTVSSLSLGCTYLYYECSICMCLLWLTDMISIIFSTLQIKENRNITLYMNESLYCCIFYFLISFHLYHVIVGILLIGLIMWSYCCCRFICNIMVYQQRVTSSHHLFYTLQLVYWHFVELLWLFIYYVLYN